MPKHEWRKDENGEIDDWSFEYRFHNGVTCTKCGKQICIYCEPDYADQECEDES